MRTRSKLATIALSTGLAFAGFAGISGSAQAATSGGTIATFTISAGSLAITIPASTVALATGTVATGATSASGPLGPVTVEDTRGALLNGWTNTVSSTTFVTGGSTANESVALTNIAYSSGLSTASSGLGVFVPSGTVSDFTTAKAAGTHTALAGNSSTTWNPTLTFTLLSSQVAGTYTGTITHSVG